MTISTPSGCKIARCRPEAIALSSRGAPRSVIALESEVIPGNVDQIALLHVVPAAQPDPAHAAAIDADTSHLSRGPDGGCSQNDLGSTGGNGLLYCFAAQ